VSSPKEIAYYNPPTRTFDDPTAKAFASTAAAAAPGLAVCRIATAAGLRAVGASPSTAQTDAANPLESLTAPLTNVIEGGMISHFAMSAPAFVPERNEVWYSDGMYGFYAVRLSDGVWSPSTAAAAPAAPSAVADPASAATTEASADAASPAPAASPASDSVRAAPDASPSSGVRDALARTGQPVPLVLAAVAIGAGLLARRARRRASSS
jgi:hypothetical protein